MLFDHFLAYSTSSCSHTMKKMHFSCTNTWCNLVKSFSYRCWWWWWWWTSGTSYSHANTNLIENWQNEMINYQNRAHRDTRYGNTQPMNESKIVHKVFKLYDKSITKNKHFTSYEHVNLSILFANMHPHTHPHTHVDKFSL